MKKLLLILVCFLIVFSACAKAKEPETETKLPIKTESSTVMPTENPYFMGTPGFILNEDGSITHSNGKTYHFLGMEYSFCFQNYDPDEYFADFDHENFSHPPVFLNEEESVFGYHLNSEWMTLYAVKTDYPLEDATYFTELGEKSDYECDWDSIHDGKYDDQFREFDADMIKGIFTEEEIMAWDNAASIMEKHDDILGTSLLVRFAEPEDIVRSYWCYASAEEKLFLVEDYEEGKYYLIDPEAIDWEKLEADTIPEE